MLQSNIDTLFYAHGFPLGRLICGSKSAYTKRYPDHDVVFNANIITKKRGKIWYGDIDLTIDADKLNELSKELGETIYVLYENDCRFENENKPIDELIKLAKWASTY